jgi:hypothetical protein
MQRNKIKCAITIEKEQNNILPPTNSVITNPKRPSNRRLESNDPNCLSKIAKIAEIKRRKP